MTTQLTTETDSGSHSSAILRLVAEIGKLRKHESKAKLDVIKRRIELGDKLTKLKSLSNHGDWARVRDDAGFSETVAQRLMRFAATKLAKQILRNAPGFAEKLPLDMDTLLLLDKLAAKELKRVLADNDGENISRGMLRDLINGAEAPADDLTGTIAQEPETDQSNNSQEASMAALPARTIRPRGPVVMTDQPEATMNSKEDSSLSNWESSIQFPKVGELLSACGQMGEPLLTEVLWEISTTVMDQDDADDFVQSVRDAINHLTDLLQRLETAANSRNAIGTKQSKQRGRALQQ